MVPFLNQTVADAMTCDPVTVRPDTTLAALRDLFEKHAFNAFPVIDGDRLAGWVAQLDLLGAFAMRPDSIIPHYDEILAHSVESIMISAVETVPPERPLSRVLMRMIETRHPSFPVVANGTLLGIIARQDIIHGLDEEMRAHVSDR